MSGLYSEISNCELIYINDDTCVVSNGKLIIYADDIALYQIIHSPIDFLLVQQNINSICAWVKQNSLLLNTLKCCYLLFSRKPTPTLPSSPLLINNTALRSTKEFKYLGVTFYLDASWTPHINTICPKQENWLACSSGNSPATLTPIHS